MADFYFYAGLTVNMVGGYLMYFIGKGELNMPPLFAGMIAGAGIMLVMKAIRTQCEDDKGGF